MYDDELKTLLELINEFNRRYENELDKAPYNLCLLDLCGANENAHTKILVQLLKYKVNKNYPFLDSFLKRLFKNKNLEFNYQELKLTFNKDLIDGLIRDNRQAIIIENKIHYAPDQNRQIEGYVEKVKAKFRIEKSNIYVVYLTRYGDKKISENSCPKELRKELGGFVESNYCYDVLPWLKEDVLPNCKWKDDNLVSALKQYIDHLEGMFGQRSSNGMEEKMKEWLKQKLHFAQTPEKYHQLDEMINKVDALRTSLEMIKREPYDSFRKITTDFWKDYFKISEDPIIIDHLYGGDPYMIIGLRKWNDSARMIHLEWKMVESDFFGERNFPFWLHIEPKAMSVDKILDELDKDDEFKRLIAETGMEFVDRKRYMTNISLNREFAFMSNESRKDFLYVIYEKYAPLLTYVYKKCEKVYEKE